MPRATDTVPRPGTLVGERYRVEQMVGRGEMGVVMRARDQRSKRAVAIKMLTGRSATAEHVTRFWREANASSHIRSDYVARVLEVGRHQGRTPFIVMEYLDGEDLLASLGKGPIPVHRAVSYAVQIARALREAHSIGIVHRDLKPSNVFIVGRGRDTKVKVLDFGLSKIAGTGSLTPTNAIIGSPLYMAPEQMKSAKDVDQRTDIWSLGVVLHEMVTGEPPFTANTFPELVHEVRTSDAPYLSDAMPEVPARISDAVRRCLSKDPNDRFQTVDELLAVLEPFVDPRARAATLPADDFLDSVEPATLQPESITHPNRGDDGDDDDVTVQADSVTQPERAARAQADTVRALEVMPASDGAGAVTQPRRALVTTEVIEPDDEPPAKSPVNAGQSQTEVMVQIDRVPDDDRDAFDDDDATAVRGNPTVPHGTGAVANQRGAIGDTAAKHAGAIANQPRRGAKPQRLIADTIDDPIDEPIRAPMGVPVDDDDADDMSLLHASQLEPQRRPWLAIVIFALLALALAGAAAATLLR